MADTLIKANPLLPAEDFVALRKQGFKEIEKSSHGVWTEYNNSDPGITILDAVCYAITDLAYRTGFEVKDLLAPEHLTPETWREIFYTARQILHNGPVTISDYRKLIIDVKGVRNAWIEMSKDYEVPVWVNYEYFELRDHAGCGCDPDQSKLCRGILLTDPIDGPALLEQAKQKFTKQKENLEATIEEAEAEYERLQQLIEEEEASGEIVNRTKWREQQLLELDKKGTALLQLKTLLDAPTFDGATGFNSKIVEFEGLYNVMVEYEEDVLEHQEREEVRQRVVERLMGHRNLCEDFLSVNAVEYLDFGIGGSIVLEEYADPDVVFANILFAIYRYFTPSVPFYTIPQMLKKGYSIDQIFEGPALRHGFVDTKELEKTELFRDIRLSDIINDVADIPGIKAITLLILPFRDWEDGGPDYFAQWLLSLRQQRKVARVDAALSSMLFCKERDFITYNTGAPSDRSPERMLKLFNDLKVIERKYKLEGVELDLPVPTGDYMNLQDYYPVTYTLPMCYGVSERAGLPADASDTRRVQALQLGGYMLFFEQLLADYLNQLSHVKELYSFTNTIDRTFYTRALTEIENLQQLVLDHQNRGEGHWDDILHDFTEVLENLVETPKTFTNRRNKFLDHLLARFSEEMTEYESISRWLTPYKVEERLIGDKTRILSHGEYFKISSNRAEGFNYSLPSYWNSDNVSGTERRVSRLLGFKQATRHALVSDIICIEAAIDEEGKKKDDQKVNKDGQPLFVIKIVDPETKEPVFTSVEVTEGCCIDLLIREILTHAEQRKNFRFEDGLKNRNRKASEDLGKYSFILYDGTDFQDGTVLARSKHYASRKEVEAAYDRLQFLLKEINDNEGFHLIEHILLRPKLDEIWDEANQKTVVKLLDICLDACDLGKGVDEFPETVNYRKRISRIPAARCFDKLPWVLEYMRLNPTKDNNGTIIDYRYDESILFQETFPDQADPVLLKFKRYEALSDRVKDIQEFGTERVNYEIVSDESDSATGPKYAFKIKGKGQVLAMSPFMFNKRLKGHSPVEDDIEIEIAALIKYFGFELDLYCKQNPCDHNEDPYSFRATALFPCWPKRFRDSTFRRLVEKTVQTESPSHVHINVVWIGFAEMLRFEKAFRRWLKEMARTELPTYEQVNPLVNQLNTVESCSDCEEGCF